MYLKELCTRLVRDKIVDLAPQHKEANDFDKNQSYQIYRKKLLSTFPLIWPKWIFLIWKVRGIVKKEGIEQILVGQILPLGTVSLILKKIWNIPFTLSTHAMDVTILKNSKRKSWLARKIIKNSQKIITVSKFTYQELIKLGTEHEKISIISPATDIDKRCYSDKQGEISNRHHLKDKLILLTVGRIVKRKGHLQVLKSLSSIIQKYPNLVYLIGSEGPAKKVLQDYISKNNLENNVIFLGEIPESDLPSYYKIADIFVMPTLNLENGDKEGFGIVYLEANAFGKPVIATRSGGVEDAVIHEQTGLLVNPDDSAELTGAITRLLDDQALARKLGEQGQNRVKAQFDWESRAEKLIKVLSE